MEIVCTLLVYWTVILNSIELSSQFDCYPNGDPIPYAGHDSAAESSSQAEPPLRVRSQSSSSRQTLTGVFAYTFEELSSIRISPHDNPTRIFELRRYTFPPDKPLYLRNRYSDYKPIPTQEQLVLSTSHGDVWAILKKASNRNTVPNGLFTLVDSRLKRAKINMNSGSIVELNSEEMLECPVGFAIAKNFRVFRV